MKFTSLICGLGVLANSVFAHPAEDAEHSLEARAILPVTGVPGSVHTRYEIQQLHDDYPNQWTLYILALKQFQAQAQSSKTSYYQIAGIHGVPRVSYDGVGECSACAGADGYCTHDSILFLGWHRAYLALFEQELVAIAKSIANKYTGSKKATMQNAAKQLRIPYWDWAAHPGNGRPTLPTLITQTSVTVTGPSGKQTFDNPLFKHTFANPGGLVYSPFKTWPHTLRYPTSNSASATSDTQKAIAAFNNIRANMQDQVYNMFSTCDTYLEVGLDAASAATTKCSNSLENIHNTIHNTAGGPKQNGISGGHMTYLSEAAFDPIFWLHHCNVDRLFALWQGLYPNSYSGSQVAPLKTWTIAKGSTQNLNSPLTPFHHGSSGSFWTTQAVRKTQTFNYNYPEFADSNGSKSAIAKYINNLYGPSATATAGSSKRTAAPPASSSTTSSAAPTSVADTPLKANNGSLYQYVANIQTSRYALSGSYNIYLFDGEPTSEEPASWVLDPNLIGPMGVTAQPDMSSAEVIATGAVPLTRTLANEVASGVLVALTEALVVPYLKKNLHWRVAGPTGASVDPNTIPNFQVSVYASTAKPTSEDALPVWSAFIPLAEITESKAGGATPKSINGTASTGSRL